MFHGKEGVLITADVVVFLCAFLKDHNFGLFSVFLEMISNITELLKEYSVFREFCKSTLDRDEIN